MIILILFCAFILRLISINQSLWLDESIGVIEVKNNDWSGILNQFLKVDNHPPLYYLLLDTWTSIFGYSELAVRLPSVIFGLGTVYLVYRIAKLLIPKNKLFQVCSTIIIATSQFHIYYSQEARMYAMAAFFASLSIYLLIKILKNVNVTKWTWVLFSFSITALLLTDYMPIFLFPVLIVFPYLRKMKKNFWVKFIISLIPLIIVGILWLPTFITQTKGGSWLIATLPSWQSVAGGANFKQVSLVVMKFVLGRISLFDKFIYYGLVAAASVPILFSFIFSLKKWRKVQIIWMWLLVPLILGFITSLFFPAFIYFRFLYIFPAFCLIAGYGLSNIKSRLFRNSFFVLIIVFNLLSFGIYITDENQQREQWRHAVDFVQQNATQNDVVLFEYPEPFTPYRWYQSGEIAAFGATDSISANSEKTVKRVLDLITRKSKVYYFEYLADLTDPARVVQKTIVNEGFRLESENGSFEGVGKIIIYAK